MRPKFQKGSALKLDGRSETQVPEVKRTGT
jgi:hypothetical protein